MKLTSVSIAGFRGVRTKFDVPFGSAFTVICGRNGTGKSTICDAIEFALRGGIAKQEEKKEDGETIADYVWWRGKGNVENQQVRLTFAGDDGKSIEVVRTPDLPSWGELDAEIVDLLCDRATMPAKPLAKLCATSILRDEDIARLSMDLSETQRFSYVREALAGEESTSLQNRLNQALAILDEHLRKVAEEVEKADRRIAELLARGAELRSKVSDGKALAEAETALRRSLAMGTQSISELLIAADQQSAAYRQQLNELEFIQAELKRLAGSVQGFDPRDGITQIEKLRSAISDTDKKRADLEVTIASYSTELELLEKQAPLYTALGQLFESGSRIGLMSDACPLCGTAISQEHLQEHIEKGRKLLDESGKRTTQLFARRNIASQELVRLNLELTRLRGDLAARVEAVRIWQANKDALDARAQVIGLKLDSGAQGADVLLLREVATRRNLLANLERTVNVLRSRDFAREIEVLDTEVAKVKADRTERDKALSLLQVASGKGWRVEADVRREINRLVDERLALLSPLTKEFYSRLRPHVVWRDLNFYVRGELRKFLGMRVGEDLNPAFMFSSGQRRAAGLAFLLSLYLARTWSSLKTVILDDPVQHIDDYRALHMAELLAAFTRSGHQVICTVEDAALADLLCRRLQSNEDMTGLRVDMDYAPEDGVKIASVRPQPAVPREVLLSA